MSNYEEQLNSIIGSEDILPDNTGVTDIVDLTPEDTDNFTVNNRTINIPIFVTDIVVQGDANSRIITFELNRYFDGVDLSLTTIFVNYKNSDDLTGSDSVSNVITTESKLYFDWAITSKLTINSGKVTIAIDCHDIDTDDNVIYRWQTVPLSFDVLETISVINNAIGLTYESERAFVDSYDNSPVLEDIHDTDEAIIITNRTINMPIYNDIVVSKDNNSQIISFTLDRYFDNIDLADKTIAIKFENAIGKSDRTLAVNVSCTEDKITFGWLIDSKVTQSSGYVLFAIEFLGYLDNGDFYCWQTKPSQIEVSEGLFVDDFIEEPSPSWLQAWELQMANIIKRIKFLENSTMQYIKEVQLLGNDIFVLSETEIAYNSPVIVSILGENDTLLVRADGVELIDRLTFNTVNSAMTKVEITANDILAGVKLTKGGTLTVKYYNKNCEDLFNRINNSFSTVAYSSFVTHSNLIPASKGYTSNVINNNFTVTATPYEEGEI